MEQRLVRIGGLPVERALEHSVRGVQQQRVFRGAGQGGLGRLGSWLKRNF